MLSTKRVLSAMVGAAMLSLPTGALAANHYDRNLNSRPYTFQDQTRMDGYSHTTTHHTLIQLADEDDYYRDHHHRHHHREWNDNDYYWGGRYRYQHPYSYFANPTPPSAWNGWNMNQRQAYLMQRRDTAIQMRREMQARGDKDAANRLSTVIQQLNGRIARGQ